MDANCETLMCVKSQQNIAWADEFWMLALATSSKSRAKIDEKLHVCWDIVFRGIFGRILGWFWEAKNIDFRIVFDVFSKQILKSFLEG